MDSDWRLIRSNPMSGAMNMALDEAILQSVQGHNVAPTLRLYAWDPPCISIGYAQSVSDTDRAEIKDLGWDLVRRPTGGKAILHTDEITYSIAAPTNHPVFTNGVLPSYERISQGLMDGLEALGLEPELHVSDSPVPSSNNPVCFQNPGAFEITVRDKKLVGSAQLRRAGGVLQHGSIPLRGDISRICFGLHYPSSEARQRARYDVVEHATSVERALGEERSWDEVAHHLLTGFGQALRIRFLESEILPEEVDRALEYSEKQYSNPAWTERI